MADLGSGEHGSDAGVIQRKLRAALGVRGRDGRIVFKLVGPITEANLPALARELEKVAAK